MKKSFISIPVALLFLSGCCKYTTTLFLKNQPEERIKYPEWCFTSPQLNLVGNPGNKYKWKMCAKGMEKKKKIIDAAFFCLPLKQKTPVAITVESKKGYPYIMATDRFIHKNDYLSLVTGLDDTIVFPGRPLAYSIGQNNKSKLIINPQYNTVVNICIWLIDGKIQDPEPEEFNYTSEVPDSFMNLFSNPMMKCMYSIDSINRYNKLLNAWRHENIKSEKKIKKSKVHVTIENSDYSNGIPLEDCFFNFYNSEDLKNVFQQNKNNNTNNFIDWHKITFKYDSLRSKAVDRSFNWEKTGVSFNNGLFDVSQETRLKNFTNNPILQSELLKRDILLNSIPDSNMVPFLTMNSGELDILKNPISKILAQQLITVGGISGAICDRKGFLLASTSPFMFYNIGNQPEWQIIEASTNQVIKSDCYAINGFPFSLKKVFIPITDTDGNKTIGWLMAEIYCK